MSIPTYITYIVYDFITLGVAWIQNIQVIGFLQDDKLFMTSPWIMTIHWKL